MKNSTKAEKVLIKNLIQQKHRVEKLSLIREIIFGTQDGLLTTLGIISSIAGASLGNNVVIIAGMADALAGGFSMAAGAYLSSKAEKQVHQAEIKLEKNNISAHFQEEKRELKVLFELEKISPKNAALITEKISKSPKSFLITMIQKEYGIEPNSPSSPIIDGLYMGGSYFIAALIPLSPYFFMPAKDAIAISISLTIITLFTLGIFKSTYAKTTWWKSGLEIGIIGILAGLGGYLLGHIFTKIF